MVKLIHNSPLSVADLAIGKCWDKPSAEGVVNCERIERVANKNKHASTIEHIVYTFEVSMSRACLQEWARHRMASLSVKSSRYTLKELKNEIDLLVPYFHTSLDDVDEDIIEAASNYLVFTDDDDVNLASIRALGELQALVRMGKANDKTKYAMPEAYKTSLVWTINARALQNFLALRTSKAALWEIRDIAYAVYYQLPKEHRFLFAELLTKEEK